MLLGKLVWRDWDSSLTPGGPDPRSLPSASLIRIPLCFSLLRLSFVIWKMGLILPLLRGAEKRIKSDNLA